MPSYPIKVRTCQQIKSNGIPCGSPAMRNHNFCYFHLGRQQQTTRISASLKRANRQAQEEFLKLTLEDENSIHIGVAQVIRLVLAKSIDHQTATTLLYALEVASDNVKNTSFDTSLDTTRAAYLDI